ncbi:MAG: tRNA preQ1(34) S-adenosylmethionine ribosyltransferase-isomerase QueA [Phycisphaerales bacterium]|nr:MAG: tRNA preQ1(34) S-adenosylmethionine ribosyltransferase-isomerase QueA [Phycisphaerales bacterium]
MKTDKLDYHLPPELIAQHPLAVRSDSRLLVLDRATGRLEDSTFDRIARFLLTGDCLVLNDTKVLPARFFARRRTGGKIEALFLAQAGPGIWQVMIKGARKIRPGETLYLKDRHRNDCCTAVLLEKIAEGICLLRIDADTAAETLLGDIGFPPLPPYIRRNDDPETAESDRRRYQTIYARKPGAVAAPTAGLHFTRKLIDRLKHFGVTFAYITLHVGPGTFMPVTAEKLEDHNIHAERFSIDAENARIINSAKKNARRIIPVGTTSVRTLETIASTSPLQARAGTTDLFITPGYKFKITDAMITNFHLPKSTLLALVAAFAGLETILAAYKHAVEQKYRFYSYGDAMLIV